MRNLFKLYFQKYLLYSFKSRVYFFLLIILQMIPIILYLMKVVNELLNYSETEIYNRIFDTLKFISPIEYVKKLITCKLVDSKSSVFLCSSDISYVALEYVFCLILFIYYLYIFFEERNLKRSNVDNQAKISNDTNAIHNNIQQNHLNLDETGNLKFSDNSMKYYISCFVNIFGTNLFDLFFHYFSIGLIFFNMSEIISFFTVLKIYHQYKKNGLIYLYDIQNDFRQFKNQRLFMNRGNKSTSTEAFNFNIFSKNNRTKNLKRNLAGVQLSTLSETISVENLMNYTLLVKFLMSLILLAVLIYFYFYFIMNNNLILQFNKNLSTYYDSSFSLRYDCMVLIIKIFISLFLALENNYLLLKNSILFIKIFTLFIFMMFFIYLYYSLLMTERILFLCNILPNSIRIFIINFIANSLILQLLFSKVLFFNYAFIILATVANIIFSLFISLYFVNQNYLKIYKSNNLINQLVYIFNVKDKLSEIKIIDEISKIIFYHKNICLGDKTYDDTQGSIQFNKYISEVSLKSNKNDDNNINKKNKLNNKIEDKNNCHICRIHKIDLKKFIEAYYREIKCILKLSNKYYFDKKENKCSQYIFSEGDIESFKIVKLVVIENLEKQKIFKLMFKTKLILQRIENKKNFNNKYFNLIIYNNYMKSLVSGQQMFKFRIFQSYEKTHENLAESLKILNEVLLGFKLREKYTYEKSKKLYELKKSLLKTISFMTFNQNMFTDLFSLILFRFIFENTYNTEISDFQLLYNPDEMKDLISDILMNERLLTLKCDMKTGSITILRVGLDLKDFKFKNLDELFLKKFKNYYSKEFLKALKKTEMEASRIFEFVIDLSDFHITTLKINYKIIPSFNLDEIYIYGAYEISNENIIIAAVNQYQELEIDSFGLNIEKILFLKSKWLSYLSSDKKLKFFEIFEDRLNATTQKPNDLVKGRINNNEFSKQIFDINLNKSETNGKQFLLNNYQGYPQNNFINKHLITDAEKPETESINNTLVGRKSFHLVFDNDREKDLTILNKIIQEKTERSEENKDKNIYQIPNLGIDSDTLEKIGKIQIANSNFKEALSRQITTNISNTQILALKTTPLVSKFYDKTNNTHDRKKPIKISKTPTKKDMNSIKKKYSVNKKINFDENFNKQIFEQCMNKAEDKKIFDDLRLVHRINNSKENKNDFGEFKDKNFIINYFNCFKLYQRLIQTIEEYLEEDDYKSYFHTIKKLYNYSLSNNLNIKISMTKKFLINMNKSSFMVLKATIPLQSRNLIDSILAGKTFPLNFTFKNNTHDQDEPKKNEEELNSSLVFQENLFNHYFRHETELSSSSISRSIISKSQGLNPSKISRKKLISKDNKMKNYSILSLIFCGLLLIYCAIFLIIGLIKHSFLENMNKVNSSVLNFKYLFFQSYTAIFFNINVKPYIEKDLLKTSSIDNLNNSRIKNESITNSISSYYSYEKNTENIKDLLNYDLKKYLNYDEFMIKSLSIQIKLLLDSCKSIQSSIYFSNFESESRSVFNLPTEFKLINKIKNENDNFYQYSYVSKNFTFIDTIMLFINYGEIITKHFQRMINLDNISINKTFAVDIVEIGISNNPSIAYDLSNLNGLDLEEAKIKIYELLLNFDTFFINFEKASSLINDSFRNYIDYVYEILFLLSLILMGIHLILFIGGYIFIKFFNNILDDNEKALIEINNKINLIFINKKIKLLEKLLSFYSDNPRFIINELTVIKREYFHLFSTKNGQNKRSISKNLFNKNFNDDKRNTVNQREINQQEITFKSKKDIENGDSNQIKNNLQSKNQVSMTMENLETQINGKHQELILDMNDLEKNDFDNKKLKNLQLLDRAYLTNPLYRLLIYLLSFYYIYSVSFYFIIQKSNLDFKATSEFSYKDISLNINTLNLLNFMNNLAIVYQNEIDFSKNIRSRYSEIDKNFNLNNYENLKENHFLKTLIEYNVNDIIYQEKLFEENSHFTILTEKEPELMNCTYIYSQLNDSLFYHYINTYSDVNIDDLTNFCYSYKFMSDDKNKKLNYLFTHVNYLIFNIYTVLTNRNLTNDSYSLINDLKNNFLDELKLFLLLIFRPIREFANEITQNNIVEVSSSNFLTNNILYLSFNILVDILIFYVINNLIVKKISNVNSCLNNLISCLNYKFSEFKNA